MSSTTSTAIPPATGFEHAVDEIQFTKKEVNQIVMNYLLGHGYPEAAHKFANEANMQPVSDLVSIAERVEVRDAIHSGDIQSAIEKINELAPLILDRDKTLHFSLLRLQLIELIRTATSPTLPSPTKKTAEATALEFAQTHLAPRAPTDAQFLEWLETTMSLLLFHPSNIHPSLASQFDSSLRQDIAEQVNKALLEAQSQPTGHTLEGLVQTRAWAQIKVTETRKEVLPGKESLGLRLDGFGEGKVAATAQNGHQNGSGGDGAKTESGDAMAVELDAP